VNREPEVGGRIGVDVDEWNGLLVSKVEEVGAGLVVIAPPSDGRGATCRLRRMRPLLRARTGVAL
jgi:hypothetical protein